MMNKNYNMPEDYLIIIRKMVFDGIDENIITDWIVGQLEKGNITTRMYELGISTLEDISNMVG